ncbi:hypothetical protein BC943DRAFT_325493 [Umbelopsis sp. AD052]|nr:hypothetical protein BC943DRAFT_325493 [Umbelopsis sp. AD052]
MSFPFIDRMLETAAEEGGNGAKPKGFFASSTHKSSALQFLKRSVENAKSAKSNVPVYPSTISYEDEETPLDDLDTSSTARRPRADTMPSLSTEFPYTDRQLPYLSLSLLPSSTPASVPPRNRSGSATLPPPESSQAFHSGIFSSPSWISQNQYVTPPTPTTDQMMKEDYAADTIASTMASLGLDDERRRTSSLHRSGSSPALRNQPQTTMHHHPLFPPVEPSVHSSTNLTTSHHHRSISGSSNQSLTESDAFYLKSASSSLRTSAVPQYLTQPGGSRPRAISLGMAESNSFQQQEENTLAPSLSPSHRYHRHPVWQAESSRMQTRRQHGLRNSCSNLDLQNMMGEASSFSNFASSPNSTEQNIMYDEWDTHVSSDHAQSLSTSPSSSQAQQPTRSLWLGNIDSSLTVNDLTHLFGMYGPIESARVLLEKECAFVNFLRLEDALAAKDDLVNKLNCRIAGHTVKVGFGKPEAIAQIGCNELGANSQGPTRALWIGNLPNGTSSGALMAAFAPFGAIESARVLTHKNCGFVNFEQQEDAMLAKKSLQNKDIPGLGPAARIGYAKVPGNSTTSAIDIDANSNPSRTPQSSFTSHSGPPSLPQASSMDAYQTRMMMMLMAEMAGSNPSNLAQATILERQYIMSEFGDDPGDGPQFDTAPTPVTYYPTIPTVVESGAGRKIDPVRLRDFRKRLDGGNVTFKEVEDIATDCMDDIVDLCSDYLGNTVVQRLFEYCCDTTKTAMLEQIAPYLGSVGIHKNGTWAAQKIVETSRTPGQIHLICFHLRPYIPALLLDQFGNYVVQCCLGLGPDLNQFIFDAVIEKCWEIAQGRFGARAMRATLESPHVTKRQQKYVASAIVQNTILLATNPNGALLLTWLLDTSGLKDRYSILVPRVIPHLAHLCTHKLASLTVLKLINQRLEPKARDEIIQHLFFSDSDNVIDEVLLDQVHGVALVQKILSTSYIELHERQHIAERSKQTLSKLKVQHVQGYKRLVEEINMVMGDSTGAGFAGVPGFAAPFALTPEFAAALQAKYLAAQQGSENRFSVPEQVEPTSHQYPNLDTNMLKMMMTNIFQQAGYLGGGSSTSMPSSDTEQDKVAEDKDTLN